MKRKKSFRFSTRLAFICLTLFACAFGVVSYHLRQMHRLARHGDSIETEQIPVDNRIHLKGVLNSIERDRMALDNLKAGRPDTRAAANGFTIEYLEDAILRSKAYYEQKRKEFGEDPYKPLWNRRTGVR